MTFTMTWDQWVILFTGVPAVFLSQSASPIARKWACVPALLGQPCWYVAAWQAGQGGIWLMSFLYTAGWLRGLWSFWIKPWRTRLRYVKTYETDYVLLHETETERIYKPVLREVVVPGETVGQEARRTGLSRLEVMARRCGL